jgi:hypothetical protein
MKVTDKRMFTPEGELREEYRFLEERARQRAEETPEERSERRAEEAKAREGAARAAAPAPGAPPQSQPPGPPEPSPAGGRPAREVAGFEEASAAGQAPAFFDLLGVMAEPIPFYLGDARLPTGESGENLEAARFYIDLLEVLRQKTAGNLTPQEADALEDLLYRLRLRYVQKRR